MNHKLIIQQTMIEQEALVHATEALKVAMSWVVDGDELSRKLSSVRFAAELFQQHVERLFALEELDGQMELILQSHPEWMKQVEEFKHEHDQFRLSIRQLILWLDRASPKDRLNLDSICEKLQDVIQHILEHNERESHLLVESTLRDTGGQG